MRRERVASLVFVLLLASSISPLAASFSNLAEGSSLMNPGSRTVVSFDIWIPVDAWRYNYNTRTWNNITAQMSRDDGSTFWCGDRDFFEVRMWSERIPWNAVVTELRGAAQAEGHDNQGGMISFQYNTGQGWSEQVGFQVPNSVGNLTVNLFALGVDTVEELNNLQLRVVQNDTDGPPGSNYEIDFIWLEVGFLLPSGLGFSLAVGDINGDGFKDIVTGAPESGGVGSVYVFFGSSLLLGNVSVGDANVTFSGEPAVGEGNSRFGFSVTSTDINGDYFDDIIIGSPDGPLPSVFFFYGRDSWNDSYNLTEASFLLSMRGEDQFGFSLTSSDINKDGYGDVFIGEPFDDNNHMRDNGRLWIALGSPDLSNSTSPNWTTNLQLSEVDIGRKASPAVGDIDADGDIDLIVGSSGGVSYGIKNIGGATSFLWTLEASWNVPDVGTDSNPSLADLDKDQDLDMLVGSSSGDLVAYENVGSRFSPIWSPRSEWDAPSLGSDSVPSLGDLDGDGDLDMVVCYGTGECYGFVNTGDAYSPIWTRSSSWDIVISGTGASPALGDFDFDGDIDLMIGSSTGLCYAFKNVGSPTNPLWLRSPSWDTPNVGLDVRSVVADMDNDGDFDMLIGDRQGTVYFVENTQDGVLSYVGRSSNSMLGYTLSSVEMNGDGYIDLIAGFHSSQNSTGVVVIRGNQTMQGWSGPLWNAKQSWDTPDIGLNPSGELADVDGDGDLDLFVGSSSGICTALKNTGTKEVPQWVAEPLWNIDTGSPGDVGIALADLDGDLDYDAMVGTSKGYVYGYRNIGSPLNPIWAREPAWDTIDLGSWVYPTLGDLDGDGDSDMLVGETSGAVLALENTGNGTSPNWTSNPSWALDIRWVDPWDTDPDPDIGDMDGDGDVDVMIGGWNGITYAFENTGTVSSPDFHYNRNWGVTQDIGIYSAPTFGDLDNDGDLDLLNGERTGMLLGYQNVQTSLFISGNPNATGNLTVLGLQDVNRDGYGDVALGEPEWNGRRGRVHFFLGSVLEKRLLSLSDSNIQINTGPDERYFGHTLASGDFNADGFSDLAVGSYSESSNGGKVYLFLGSSEWSTMGSLSVEGANMSLTSGTEGDEFGFSAASGNLNYDILGYEELVIGAPRDDEFGIGSGKVYIYNLDDGPHAHLLPENSSMNAGSIQTFTITIHNRTGIPRGLKMDVRFNLTTTSPTGVFYSYRTANEIGSITLAARSSSVRFDYTDTSAGIWRLGVSCSVALFANSSVTVIHSNLDSVAINPYPSITTQAGSPVFFLAQSYDSYGNTIDGGIRYSWSLHGIGSLLSNTGRATVFSSNRIGTGDITVEAWEGNNVKRNSSRVLVRAGPLSYILVNPSNATVYANESVTFSAQGYDLFNNPVEGIEYYWSLQSGLGSLNTTQGVSVRFDAGPLPSSGFLNVTNGSISASAQIEVLVRAKPTIALLSPSDGEHLTGAYVIQYSASPDATSVYFEYFNGVSWELIGSDDSLDGFYDWQTSPINNYNATLRAYASNTYGSAYDDVLNLEIDNLPPNITIISPLDFSRIEGNYVIEYKTDNDTMSVEFRYMDQIWHSIGIDSTVDGSYSWDVSQLHLTGIILEAIATDEVGLVSTTTRMGINVGEREPVANQPPDIGGVPDIIVHYDHSYNFDLTPYIHDDDNSSEDLTVWTSDSEHIWTSPENNLALVMNYPQSMLNERVRVTIWVTDGIGTDYQVINVTISEDYPPEKLRPLPDVSFNEDEISMNVFYVNLDYYFLDVDGDNLYYTSGNKSVQIRINENNTVDMWAEKDWFGFELITIRATDPTGALVEDLVLVWVVPVNDAPVIGGISEIHVRARERLTIDLAPFIYDIDSPIDVLSISTNSEYVQVSGLNLTLQYPLKVREETLTITVSDGIDSSNRSVRVIVHSAGEDWLLIWVLMVATLVNVLAWAAYLIHRPEVFCGYLLREDGSLIKEISLKGKETVPYGFILERIKGKGILQMERLDLEKYRVTMIHGNRLHLAVVSTPYISRFAIAKMREAVEKLDNEYFHGSIVEGEKEEAEYCLQEFVNTFRRISKKA